MLCKIAKPLEKSVAAPLLCILLTLTFLPAASGTLGWTPIGGPGNGNAKALAYDNASGYLYRGTNSRGAWRYKSGTWTDMGLGNVGVSDFAYDSANNILYVLAGTVYRCDSPDTSPTWTSLGRTAQSIVYDSGGGGGGRNLLYAASGAGVWRCSTPNGTPSWTDVSGALGTGYDVWDLEMDPAHDQLYAGTSSGAGGHGAWRCDSPDSSPSWSDTGEISTYYVHYLLYDAGHNKLYAGATLFADSQTWRCDNPGTAPDWTGIGFFDAPMAYDASRNLLYSSKWGVSTRRCADPDTAPVWTKLDDTLLECEALSLAFDSTSNILYVGAEDSYLDDQGGVWRCTTPNATPGWSNLGGNISEVMTSSLAVDVSNNRLYFGCDQYGVWRCDTPDTNPTYTDIWGGNVYGMKALALNSTGDTLYVGMLYGGGVQRCDDPGTTPSWTRITSGYALDSYPFYSIAYDETRNVLYAGTQSNGIWRCDNPDTTPVWTDISGSFSADRGLCLTLDETHNKLFAGIGEYPGHGLWRCDTPDTAPSWVNMDPGGTLESRYFMVLDYDEGKDLLYCGVDLGVYRCETPASSPVWTRLNTRSTGIMAYDPDNNVLFTWTSADQHQRCDNPDATPSWTSIGGPSYTAQAQVCDGTRRLLYEGSNYVGDWSYGYLPPAPSISSISPDKEHIGHTVTIYGSNFGNSQGAVTFNGTLCQPGDYVSWGHGMIQVKVPVGATDGNVVVSTDGGDSNGYSFDVLDPPPTISSIYPATGILGTEVSITNLAGSGFFGTPAVELRRTGSTAIGASGVSVNPGGTQITCTFTIPAEAATGAWDVSIRNPDDQEDTLNNAFTVEYPAPTVTDITPSSGTQGTTVSITNLAGTNFMNPAVVKLKKSGSSDITASSVSVVSPTQITCSFVLPAGAASGAWDLYVQNPDNKSAKKTGAFQVNSPRCSWYLAEGTTAWGFDAYISIMNPNTSALTGKITYMLKGGETKTQDVPLPANSQATVNPRDTVGDRDFSTRVVSSDLTRPIAVDRTMSWTGGAGGNCNTGVRSPWCKTLTEGPVPTTGTGTGIEAHSSVGVNSPAKTWYMPEGSTNWGFETWLCIQNPNSGKATCQVTYMIEGSDPVTKTKEVGGNSRETYNMAEDIGNRDASIKVSSDIPVIPERSMYRNSRREGHESIGTTASASRYYLAEGTTDYGFTSYICVQNPNASDITVDITYMTEGGPKPHPLNPIPMKANSRKTVRVNDFLPNTDFSTQVTGTKPIIAERAMYWDNGTGEACHDSIGMASPHMTFYLPDGQSSEGRETYTCVQNPNGTAVEVTITYLHSGGGTPVIKTESIPANTRKTFPMLEHSGINGRASVMVVSNDAGKPIMVERAMYWNSRGAGTDTIGGAAD